MSRTGLIAAALYLAGAIGILVNEARNPPVGGWITLKTMVPFLVTFPVSAPLAMLGMEPDLNSRATVALLITLCAVLFYYLGALIGRWLGWR